MTSIPSEALETGESHEEELELPQLSPAEERIARVEGTLNTIQNQVGYIGRKLEALQSQPQTPARDERIDALMEQFQDLRLSLITDPDEREKVYQQRLEAARKPAETVQRPQPSAEETPAQTRSLDDRRKDAFFDSIVTDAWEFARGKGINLDFEGFATRYGNRFVPLSWGEPTPGDPLGKRPLWKAIQDMITADAQRIKNGEKSRTTPAETTRGSSGGARDYSNVDLKDVPDDEFQTNMAEIARQRIAAQRR